MEIKLVWGDH